MYTQTQKEECLKYNERKEYLKEYRKNKRKITIDLTIEEKEKLDYIVKYRKETNNKYTMTEFIRECIEENYKQ
jgi:hypothetical protein|nr:MAG TPA: NikA, BACTERIAL CONJUGATION, RELAXASE, DNA [Caudoviricetes sp.]